jgi:hypothetical protein
MKIYKSQKKILDLNYFFLKINKTTKFKFKIKIKKNNYLIFTLLKFIIKLLINTIKYNKYRLLHTNK